MAYKHLIKECCEICNLAEPKALQFHHIIERTEINSDHNPFNIAIICASCHALCHSGKVKIIGVYPATKLPNGRILVFEKDGIKNIDIDEPYYKPKIKQYKLY